MAESPMFNQVYYTSAWPDQVMQHLSLIRAPGWNARPGGPATIIWIHRYTTTAVLIVGIILLLLTLVGGLLLLVRSEESLIANAVYENGRTKVILTGVADQYMAGALFYALQQMPPG